ncbi:17747_t:CDS:2, partial [Entrophospora sp. SA101]
MSLNSDFGQNSQTCETEETKDTRLIKFFQNSVPRDNNAYVAINDKEKAIVVAFRGTANVKSFLNDLEFLQVPFFDKSNNAK